MRRDVCGRAQVTPALIVGLDPGARVITAPRAPSALARWGWHHVGIA